MLWRRRIWLTKAVVAQPYTLRRRDSDLGSSRRPHRRDHSGQCALDSELVCARRRRARARAPNPQRCGERTAMLPLRKTTAPKAAPTASPPNASTTATPVNLAKPPALQPQIARRSNGPQGQFLPRSELRLRLWVVTMRNVGLAAVIGVLVAAGSLLAAAARADSVLNATRDAGEQSRRRSRPDKKRSDSTIRLTRRRRTQPSCGATPPAKRTIAR